MVELFTKDVDTHEALDIFLLGKWQKDTDVIMVYWLI